MVRHVVLLVAGLLTAPAPSRLSVMTWNVCAGTNSACPLYRAGAVELADAAGRRAVAPAYRAYQECDQRGARRSGRWTREGKKLDYLFAPKGSVRRCRVEHDVTLSDHKPVYAGLAL
ncbi:hypothetical protein ACFOY2_19960 [Nonomuraea purpurea]|uniref:Endonuclease/exonuclease/phosphatase family protein n=1 Tax=Nonomuraea purpurea TaxID=1849276 RepID=A0ABV8G685_9ACTN